MPLPYPAGRFGAGTELNSLKCSGNCDPGYFCPRGSRIRRPDHAQQGDLSAILVAHMHPIVQFAQNRSTVKRPRSLEVPVLLEGKGRARTPVNQCSGDCPPGSFVRSRQTDPSVVREEHTVCWASCMQKLSCWLCCKILRSIKCEDVKGSYAAFSRSTQCTCSPGHFQNVLGQTQCTECPVGYFQGSLNATECNVIDGGYHGVSKSSGATQQIECPPRTARHALECTSCPHGWSQPEYRSTTCLKCAGGQEHTAMGHGSALGKTARRKSI